MMRLSEMKNIIDVYIAEGLGDAFVFVALNEPSVGPIRTTEITELYPGFDWDSGKILITTKDKICRLERSKDDLFPMILFVYKYETKTVVEAHCPRCEGKLKKDDNYCHECGQRVYYDKDNVVQEYNFKTRNGVNVNERN